MSAVTFRRIRADEVQPWMRVDRQRGGRFAMVTATEALLKRTRITLTSEHTWTITPKHATKLWLREDEQASEPRQCACGQPLDEYAPGLCGACEDEQGV